MLELIQGNTLLGSLSSDITNWIAQRVILKNETDWLSAHQSWNVAVIAQHLQARQAAMNAIGGVTQSGSLEYNINNEYLPSGTVTAPVLQANIGILTTALSQLDANDTGGAQFLQNMIGQLNTALYNIQTNQQGNPVIYNVPATNPVTNPSVLPVTTTATGFDPIGWITANPIMAIGIAAAVYFLILKK